MAEALGGSDLSASLPGVNQKGQPIQLKCGGEYCNIEDMMGLQKDRPDYHYEKLTKLSNDHEKKGIQSTKSFSFAAEAANLLPESDSLIYKIPNMIILIDQDIKSLW